MSKPALRVAAVATSIAVVGVAGVAIYFGQALARYEIAAFALENAPPAFAASFVDTIGLRARAREALAPDYLLEFATPAEVESVLAVDPTNGRYWLGLAENSRDPARALSALHVSEAVEPRESALMGQRAAFILAFWETMPESDRRLGLDHLAELGESLASQDRDAIARILAAKSEPARAEIRAELARKPGVDARLPAFLGL